MPRRHRERKVMRRREDGVSMMAVVKTQNIVAEKKDVMKAPAFTFMLCVNVENKEENCGTKYITLERWNNL